MPVYIPAPTTPAGTTLAAGYYQKPFPTASVVVPTLTSYQMWFNNLKMGGQSTSGVNFTKLEGLDMPDVRTGDAGRARVHGLFIGLDVMGGRTITATAQLGPVPGVSFLTNWQALADATVPGGVIEPPLYLSLPGFGTLVTMAKVRKNSMPIDIQFALGNLADISLMWGSSDPRLYSTPTVQQSVSPPGTTSGFAFPLTFPLSFGGGSYAGSMQVVNLGNIDCPAIFTITGPCTNPSITNATLPGSPTLQFSITMNAGDQMVIDTDFHNVTYYTAGSSIGSSRYYTLVRGSTWFTIPGASGLNMVPSGLSTIQFLTGDPVATGTLTCQSANAWIL